MQGFRRAACGAAVVIMMVLCAPAPFAAAQVLDQVPSDALVVLKIKGLAATSTKFSKWAEAVGLAAYAPAAADPLAALKQEMKIEKGLDEEGDLAFVYLDPAAAGGNEDKSMLILVPVTDYKAFLGNFAGAKTNGAVTEVKVGNSSQPGFVANWGKYAAISPTKEIIGMKPKGLKLSGLAAKEGESKDALLYANMPALREKLLPQLKQGRDKLMPDIERNFGRQEAMKPYLPVIKAAVDQGLNVAEQFLMDSSAATLGLSINDQGITVTVMSDFTADSYIGKLTAGTKNTDAPLTVGLPDRKYYMYGGAVLDPAVASKLAGDLLDPIVKELAETKDAKQYADALVALKAGTAATKSVAFGYAQPVGKLGEEGVVQVVSVMKGDAKQIQKSQSTVLKSYGALLNAVPDAGGKMKIEFMPGAKTIGGVKFDQYKMDMQMADAAQADQMKMITGVLYGPEGMTGTMGAVNDETFIVVQGGNEKLLTDTVASSKTDTNPFAKTAGMKMVDGNLPKKRLLVEYIALDNIMTTAGQAIETFAGGTKLKLPASLPPIGMSVATEGTAFRVDTFIPTQTIQSIVAAGMQAAMEIQGGNKGAPDKDGL